MTDSPGVGEVWWADVEPAVGSEANKARPVVVIGSDAFHAIQVRVIVPFTTWQRPFESHRNKVRVPSSPENGLEIDSAADGLLIRSVSVERFRRRVGRLGREDMNEVMRVVAIVLRLTNSEMEDGIR